MKTILQRFLLFEKHTFPERQLNKLCTPGLKVNCQDSIVRQKLRFECDNFVIIMFFFVTVSCSIAWHLSSVLSTRLLLFGRWICGFYISAHFLSYSIQFHLTRRERGTTISRTGEIAEGDNWTIRTKTLLGHHWRQFYCLQASFLTVPWWAKKGNWLWRGSPGGGWNSRQHLRI